MKITCLKFYLVAMLLLTAHSSVKALVTVGQTNDCDYDNILAAYLDDDVFVAVTNEVTYTDSFIISKAKVITGGFDSCAAAVAGNPGENKTKWSRNGAGTVIAINANQVGSSAVILSNFEVFGGDNPGFDESGGLSIAGNNNVIISNSEFYDNRGDDGGAIKITGSQAAVTFIDVLIYENTADAVGGGIYCEDQASVTIRGLSSIKNNDADIAGGGIYATTACQLTSNSGDTETALQAQYGIIANEAWQGGGIYLDAGATLDLVGNTEHPASVIFNESLTNADEGGGGIFMTGSGTELNAVNARIELNIAKLLAGGVAVYDQARFNMRRLNSPCWDNNKCSVLANNIVTDPLGGAGAMTLFDGAVVNISQTHVAGNKANLSAVFQVSNASYLRLEGNLMTENRHWSNSNETQLIALFGGNLGGSSVDFFYNTLVNNQAIDVFELGAGDQHTLSIHNSIINHQGITLNEQGNSNNLNSTDCVFMSESASLTGNTGVVLTSDPGFVDPNNANYQLSAESDAIDLCDEQLFIGAAFNDIAGQERGVDNPTVQNFLGPYDVGAYEFKADLIFKNSFE